MNKCNCSSQTCVQEEEEIEMFSVQPGKSTKDFFTKYKTPLIAGSATILLLVMFVIFLKRRN